MICLEIEGLVPVSRPVCSGRWPHPNHVSEDNGLAYNRTSSCRPCEEFDSIYLIVAQHFFSKWQTCEPHPLPNNLHYYLHHNKMKSQRLVMLAFFEELLSLSSWSYSFSSKVGFIPYSWLEGFAENLELMQCILTATNISMMTTAQSAIAVDLDAFDQATWFTSAYLVGHSRLLFNP